MATLFTIGHGTRTTAALIEALRSAGVRLLVDVRRFPASRRNPHLARAPLDGTIAPRLIQVDSRYTLRKADRGRPRVSVLDAAAWNAGPLRLLNPIAATVTASDTDLPRIRFVMEVAVPVVRGTRRIRESREE